MFVLHEFARTGDVKSLTRLLDDGINVNATDDDGFTPLHCAAACGQLPAMALLIKKGAQVDVTAQGVVTPLHLAIHRGHTAVARLLLEHGADAHNFMNGNAPIRMAAQSGDTALIALLIEQGVDVSVRDKASTALLTALSHPNAQERFYETATRLLLSAGANVNEQDDVGFCALHYAAFFGREDVVKVLLEYGADTGLLSRHRMTPADVARMEGHLAVVTLLEKHDTRA